MAYDIEEQEKIDALKDWWDKNGTRIVILAFVAALAVLGWRGYQWYEEHQATKAMGYFEALETASLQNNEQSKTRLLAASEALRHDHPKSAYTNRAVLLAAQYLQQNQDAEAASEQLSWLIQHANESAIVGLAQLRLANLRFEQQNYDQALELLKKAPAAYEGLYADRRGDVYYAQKQLDQAQREWEQAVQALAQTPYVQIVQLKLDALTKE